MMARVGLPFCSGERNSTDASAELSVMSLCEELFFYSLETSLETRLFCSHRKVPVAEIEGALLRLSLGPQRGSEQLRGEDLPGLLLGFARGRACSSGSSRGRACSSGSSRGRASVARRRAAARVGLVLVSALRTHASVCSPRARARACRRCRSRSPRPRLFDSPAVARRRRGRACASPSRCCARSAAFARLLVPVLAAPAHLRPRVLAPHARALVRAGVVLSRRGREVVPLDVVAAALARRRRAAARRRAAVRALAKRRGAVPLARPKQPPRPSYPKWGARGE